jgi:GNAT superfamily N-acetyltransferase
MALHIRPGTSKDAALLSDLAFRSKAFWGYSDEFMQACREELSYSADEIGTMLFGVAEERGNVVGFYALCPLSADDIELDAMFLEPDAIGQGHGRTLIEHAKAIALETGAKHMIIQGDPNAAPFYLATGGVLTGTRESDSIPGRQLPTFRVDLVDDAVNRLTPPR